MDMILVYFCIYIAEGITAWSYFSGLYKRKYSLWICVMAHTLGYGIAFLIFNFADMWVNTSVFPAICFLHLFLEGGYFPCGNAHLFINWAGVRHCFSPWVHFR